MSTSGAWGFRKNGKDKATHNHADSYPTWLGNKIGEMLQDTTIDELNKIYDRIELIDPESKPTSKQKGKCFELDVVKRGQTDDDDWYCLLYGAQRDMNVYKKGLPYMLDGTGFISKGLWCQWAYVINLDTNMLEFYNGYQREPQEGNFYGTDAIHKSDDGKKRYPVKKYLEIALEDVRRLPEDWADKVEEYVYKSEEDSPTDSISAFTPEDVFGNGWKDGTLLLPEDIVIEREEVFATIKILIELKRRYCTGQIDLLKAEVSSIDRVMGILENSEKYSS